MDTEITDGAAGNVRYRALHPTGPAPHLPLILLLHGAHSSADLVGQIQPIAAGMWADGSLPPSVLACASTPTEGGFYLGPWETFVADTFPAEIHQRFGTDPARISLMGASMGGYGALRLAFADPHRWESVAATAPALLNDDPGPRNTRGVLAALRDAMAEAGWADASALHRLRANADAIRAADLPIMLRCGDNDAFALHDGTERLHRELWDLDIAHDYHLVRGGDHAGPEALAAMRAALAFIGAAQRARTGADRTDRDRELEAAWQAWDAEQPAPPLDLFGPSGPAALRAMLGPEPAGTSRRYGRL